jgi:hypothetical protein
MTQPLEDCPGCGADEAFEQVHPGGTGSAADCPDLASGGEACTEWVCSGCGAGVFMGTVITGTSGGTARRTFLARQSARAA